MTLEPGTVTILFTDLVDSTELLQRAGDEAAQRIFQTHHKLLSSAVAAYGGQEVKWEGDSLMAAFSSVADAVRCAVTMQQTCRRPAGGQRLTIRVGMNVGEALREEKDYFGTPVVVAKRLCDRAEGGQILCSTLISGLLQGRQAFKFRDRGQMELKGLAPIATCEVLYEADDPAALLDRPPFVGRAAEAARLDQKLQETRAGHGSLVMLVGEPGIGKTRIAEEFTEAARRDGTFVLWGRCYEGDWAAPYSPFSEAIEEYGRLAEPEELRRSLGRGAGPLSRLAPALRERVPDIVEPALLQPDEERFRLLDAYAQFLITASALAPVVLVLDDLHWADRGTIAMLRHVGRYTSEHAILVVGAYRDVELDRQHPLADALGSLRRQTHYDRIVLKGLAVQEVGQLLAIVAPRDPPEALISAISTETDGNPFFIREVLLQLAKTGKLQEDEGGRRASVLSIDDMGIPEGVRQAVGQRLSRLSPQANRFLGAAAAVNGVFRFDIAASVAGLDERVALDAVDEALEAKILRPGGEPDTYDFAHAIIRHTLYTELNPSRQVRLHRQIAEAMERVCADNLVGVAADLAYQYQRSATLPGAERGFDHAARAAERAEMAYARDDAVTFLRIALELLPDSDPRRPRLLARLALALAWALNFPEAVEAATDAGERIAASEGREAAADYLKEAARTLDQAGFLRGAWTLAARGLRHAAGRRDATWVWLMVYELMRREAEDPDDPGIPLVTPERRELASVVERLALSQGELEALSIGGYHSFTSRDEVLARAQDNPMLLTFRAGECRRALVLWREQAERAEKQGQIAWAAGYLAFVARCHNTLGNFAPAREAYDHGMALAARLAGPSPQVLQLAAARWEMRFNQDEGWAETLDEVEPLLRSPAAENQWAFAAIRAYATMVYARLERPEQALRWLETVLSPLERAPGWAPNYVLLPCLPAYALWLLGRTDHIVVIERNLREKVLAPDFRFPMQEGRLSLARLCALQGRYEEAAEWFNRARSILDQEGARPLRALADFDEALLYVRRAAEGDRERALPLLSAALRQFQNLGMNGWTERAEKLVVQAQGSG